jgi:ubiquitin-activating enzyme E1
LQVVVITGENWSRLLEINDFTHANKIKFIAADVRGLFGFVFCDFGLDFTVTDITGERPLSGMIASISREKEGIVTCLDEHRHGLEDGDHVSFEEVKGMVELNGAPSRPIKVLGPYTFSIGDTTMLSEYVSGGLFHQVKQPKKLTFVSI